MCITKATARVRPHSYGKINSEESLMIFSGSVDKIFVLWTNDINSGWHNITETESKQSQA